MEKSITDISSRDKHNLRCTLFPGIQTTDGNASRRVCKRKEWTKRRDGSRTRRWQKGRKSRRAAEEPEAVWILYRLSSGLLRSLVMFGTEHGRRWEKGGKGGIPTSPCGSSYRRPHRRIPIPSAVVSSKKDVERILASEGEYSPVGLPHSALTRRLILKTLICPPWTFRAPPTA